MDDSAVFERLFEVARTSKDPEGVVAAALVRDGVVLEACASSDDGRFHAEYLVIRRATAAGIPIDAAWVLYTTLIPCSDLPAANDGADCTTCLLDAGVRHVVFAALDPEHGSTARTRFERSGGSCRQVGDPHIVRRARDLFNATLRRDLSALRLPRSAGL